MILFFLSFQPGHFARECPDGDNSGGKKSLNRVHKKYCLIFI